MREYTVSVNLPTLRLVLLLTQAVKLQQHKLHAGLSGFFATVIYMHSYADSPPCSYALGNINSNTFAQHINSALNDEGNMTAMLIYTAGAQNENTQLVFIIISPFYEFDFNLV